jgi:hypothetical protein
MPNRPGTEKVDWRNLPFPRKADPEKLRTIGVLRPGYKKSTKTRVVPRDDNGKRAGTETDHFYGERDARIELKPHTQKMSEVLRDDSR